MKGSDFLQKLLRTYDINRIFGVLGREAASITFTEEHSQDFFLVRNELTAGMAAISASRLTGKPQVCFSTLGPGVTHMAYSHMFSMSRPQPSFVLFSTVRDSCNRLQ